MGFPYNAVPPIKPIEGAAIDTSDLTLVASDGNNFAAFRANSDEKKALE